MKREVIVFEGLTKDQLYDMMSTLPEELLADIQWAAEVELMDRAFTAEKGVDNPLGPVYTDM